MVFLEKNYHKCYNLFNRYKEGCCLAKRSTMETCCLTLPLVLEKWQSDRLEKRFEIARQIYNTLLNYELKKLRRLEKTKEYEAIQGEIQKQLECEQRGAAALKDLYRQRDKLRKDAGFTEYDLKTDIKDFYKHFNDNIGSSVAVHGIASQVWAAFERLFYGNGKAVHFKKRGDIRSLRGYSVAGKSGGVEIIFRGTFVEWKGLKLPIKLDAKNAYETEMLQKRVKYCRIIKKPGKNKLRWYVQLMLEGKPAVKVDAKTGELRHPIGSGAVGIDIGPQTIAYAAKTEVALRELADGVKNIEREKRLILRKLDRSRRAANPGNFAEDGTIIRGIKLNWVKSKNYARSQRELAYLQYQQSEIRKRQHTELANHLLSLGDRFYVEDMEWPALTHRAKETAISEKTGRYKRKKRFGKSVGNKAPAMLIGILNQKLLSLGSNGVVKVPTSVRASQFDHITGEYHKKPLGQRWNDMPDGRRIQRDLYSAFLLQHMNEQTDGFDVEALNRDYDRFTELHDRVIAALQSAPKTVSSMGIVRTAS